MKGLGWFLGLLGLGMAGGGAYAAYVALTTDDAAVRLANGIIAASLLLFGALLLFRAKSFMRQLGNSGGKVRNGVPGYGQVISIQDTGVTINRYTMVLVADVHASAEGIAAFPAKVQLKLGRTQWGQIQPGMSLPLLIDPVSKAVEFDANRPVTVGAPAFGGGAGAAPGVPGVPGGVVAGGPGAQVVQRSAAEVAAAGVPVIGTLLTAAPAGLTAGQVNPNLPPDQADDALYAVSFNYPGPGGQQLTMNAMVRLPDGKALVPGTPVPVSYLPDQPNVATIDFSRLG